MAINSLGKSNKVIISGFKDVSLVDVLGYPSFTIWFSYCNFRCPWCQNWPIVIGKEAMEMNISELIQKIKEEALLVEYLHITGGEPTLQSHALKVIYEKSKEIGLKNSLNTNGYNYNVINELVSLGLLDHVAMDIKAPLSMHEKYSIVVGLRGEAEIPSNIKRSLEIIANGVDLIELRTTYIPILSTNDLIKIAIEVKELMSLAGRDDIHYVLQQFVPNKNAPDPAFKEGEIQSVEKLVEIAKEIKKVSGIKNMYVRSLEEGLTRI